VIFFSSPIHLNIHKSESILYINVKKIFVVIQVYTLKAWGHLVPFLVAVSVELPSLWVREWVCVCVCSAVAALWSLH